MNHEKTFAAIKKLQEIEIELHRLKNALEMANKALDAKREWVGLTMEEVQEILNDPRYQMKPLIVHAVETKLKEKNNT